MSKAKRPAFEMSINDVFVFEDGRTVFVGRLIHGPDYIPSCDCELVLDGIPVAKFRAEGEMLPLIRVRKGLRSVSTKEKIAVGAVERAKGRGRLRSL